MATGHPGYERLVYEIISLFAGRVPPFLYINDRISVRTTGNVVNSVLSSISRSTDASSRVYHAKINAAACITPRMLYDTILNQLVEWQVKWEDGCKIWPGTDEQRWNENLDGFFHGLKAAYALRERSNSKMVVGYSGQIIIVIERAERLPDHMPDLLVPLTRLAELTQLDLSVIFVSEVPWEDIRPPFGGSPDPYYIDVAPLAKEAVLHRLNSNFDALSSKAPTTPNPYHPNLRSLYSQFASVILDTCFLYVQDSNELQYIAAARWPGFVKSILPSAGDQEDDRDVDMVGDSLQPPSEDTRMRLIRTFKPSFKAALETLYPRLDHAKHWAAAQESRLGSSQESGSGGIPDRKGDEENEDGVRITDLPRMSKFILIAAHLASTNPPKSDLKLFGRGLDEKKRKRRRANTKSGGGAEKAPQRVLGPNAFPLDRLLAILGALLEENDVDRRLPPPEPYYTIPGEETDVEIARVGVYGAIIELSSTGLLHRTSASDKLDGPPTFKCGISSETAKQLAGQVGVALHDLLWDPA
ncbi:origin recognition complex subunit 5 C-terminus-domain-containing protein [Favolaschia claudopus]|uniref:Origin recognition complex subunit 5 C-terminus-domain-containing protein n=1 Tax=Favolaschia claudopus TaxID=2862362 RepID=A0AAW0DL13_9AGAR